MIKKIARFFGWLDTGKSAPEKPDIRYAHPSHDPASWNRQQTSSSKSSASPQAQPVPSQLKKLEEKLKDTDKLKQLTLASVEQSGRAGKGPAAINEDVIAALVGSSQWTELLLSRKWVREKLSAARKSLKAEGRIGYSTKSQVWYGKAVTTRNLTAKEERFLASQGLTQGWRNIANEIEAIRWLYQNFTPDEFENFCVSIMKTHCKVPLTVTEKRRISGADGGFDGTGTYMIEGKHEYVALQAKCYAPDSQVGEDQCDRFVGALIKNGWRHGFMVTTGTFSARLIDSVKKFEKQDIWIELIDQHRLAQIMLTRTTEPHGYGLHRTDLGLVYINEKILCKAALK